MKTKRFTFLISAAILVAFFSSCSEKESVPEVNTAAVTDITRNTATAGGGVVSDGGSEILERGVCWSTMPGPTISNTKMVAGTGTGDYSVALNHLHFGTTYFLRAYAINSRGTGYGGSVVFTTQGTGFNIGQAYGGGIIFYLDWTGEHGIICAEADQGSVHWSDQTKATGATAVEIGEGRSNTDQIVEVLNPLGIPSAAKLCDDLELNGYSDWYLPSKDEMTAMYDNLGSQDLGGFGWKSYWNSSELSETHAWSLNFRVGEKKVFNKKEETFYVRAVRSF